MDGRLFDLHLVNFNPILLIIGGFDGLDMPILALSFELSLELSKLLVTVPHIVDANINISSATVSD